MTGHGNHAAEEITAAVAEALRRAGILVGDVDLDDSAVVFKTEKDGPRIRMRLENLDAADGRAFIEGRRRIPNYLPYADLPYTDPGWIPRVVRSLKFTPVDYSPETLKEAAETVANPATVEAINTGSADGWVPLSDGWRFKVGVSNLTWSGGNGSGGAAGVFVPSDEGETRRP